MTETGERQVADAFLCACANNYLTRGKAQELIAHSRAVADETLKWDLWPFEHPVALALFHDIVEDCVPGKMPHALFAYSLDIPFGKTEDVITLTRCYGESYDNYIRRVLDAGSATAKFVKFCDLTVNHRRSTAGPSPSKRRAARYAKALTAFRRAAERDEIIFSRGG